MSTPYADEAWTYRRQGWDGVIPLGRKGRFMYRRRTGEDVYGTGKFPPPVGFTGHAGEMPSGADVQAWCDGIEAGDNLGLRLPKGTYGNDVDAHSGKPAEASLRDLAAKVGSPLPPTWSSTARGDGHPARTNVYRAEPSEGRVWIDHPGPGLDALHHGHRYLLAWPSIHPDLGTQVRWYTPDGALSDRPPRPDELTQMPAAWIEALTKPGDVLEGVAASDGATVAALEAFRTGDPCQVVTDALAAELARIEAALRQESGFHDPGPLHRLVCLGVEGHAGVRRALAEHSAAYVAARGAMRGAPASVSSEWWRMVQGSVGKRLHKSGGEILSTCDCGLVGGGGAFDIDGLVPSGSATSAGADPAGATPAPAPATPQRAPQNLPAAFWASRPVLARIKDAADAQMCSPDAVFGAVLARLSSFISPKVRVETGSGTACLNVFVTIVGSSSAGKTRANKAAKQLLPVPFGVLDYRDSLPLGSGEGIAEAYYGLVSRDEDTGEVYGPRHEKAGQPKMKRVTERAKVRDGVSFYLDEGEALSKMLERAGATVGQTLRTAWVGEDLGATNASADRTRLVEAGTYALGLVIGYQRATAAPLLADQGGTPQRFLFFSAHRSDPPERRTDWPGSLTNLGHALPTTDLVLPEAAKEELFQRRRAAMLPDAPDEGLNGHWPLHMAKTAALLAVLDFRGDVTEDDWHLAAQVWETSCAVRDGLVNEIEAAEAQRRRADEDRAVRTQVRATVAGHQALEAAGDAQLERVARWVGVQVHDKGRRAIRGEGGLLKAADSRSRPRLTAAVAEAAARGWITVDDDAVAPGSARPL